MTISMTTSIVSHFAKKVNSFTINSLEFGGSLTGVVLIFAYGFYIKMCYNACVFDKKHPVSVF